jgi:hypothetical protein
MTEDRNRRPVTIEDLLIWAYHDQMVHQARQLPVELVSGSKGPLAAYSSLWNDGAPVESSRKLGFDAAEDAWRIHALVMKLGTTKVDCGQDLAAARYHALEQYRGAEPPIGRLGTVDKTARSWPTNGIVDIDLRVLVILHASRATRPDDDLVADFRMKPGDHGLARSEQSRRLSTAKAGIVQHITADGVLPGHVLQAWALYEALARRPGQPGRIARIDSSDHVRCQKHLPAPIRKPRAPA